MVFNLIEFEIMDVLEHIASFNNVAIVNVLNHNLGMSFKGALCLYPNLAVYRSKMAGHCSGSCESIAS